MLSFLWKFICFYFLLRAYGPEITSETVKYHIKLLSKEYCNDHENKSECIFEQIKNVVLLANDTYYAVFANLTKYIEKSGIKHTVRKYFVSDKDISESVYQNPDPTKEKVNVTTTMSTMLDQMQQKLEETHPGDSIEKVRERLKTIATDYRHAKGFCTLKIGVHPFAVLKLINEVAELTKMPRRLQNILQYAVNVMNADSSVVRNEPFAVNGLVHYILIAAYRNGKT